MAIPMDNISIRPMHAGDLVQVQTIDRISFSMPWSNRAYYYELYENPNSLLWVAENRGEDGCCEVVGMIVIWLILDEAHIATLAVHPDFRRMGIAYQLLQTALIAGIQKGARSATLEVRAHNTIAQGLYHHLGFEIVGHRPRYYRDNDDDAIIMTASDLGPAYQAWLENQGWQYQTHNTLP
jgi:ribosomal-protein-alanine N-acetyltransferase